MTSSPIIETNRLIRDFKSMRAVNELTLSVASGELFGLVGPDGAGKTTTLRLLAGLLDISEGDATILGFDLKQKAESIKPHTLIHYLPYELAIPLGGESATSIVGHVILGTSPATWAPVYSSVIAIALFVWLGIWTSTFFARST